MTAAPITDRIEHLDGEWNQPCQNAASPCDNAAEWIVWVGVCCPDANGVWLWCQRCLDANRAIKNLTCIHCGAGKFPTGDDVIRRVEPLNQKGNR